MRISKKCEYALRALAALARAGRSFQIQELSTQENIPVKFLEQILLTMRRAGFLNSKRGVAGGYALGVKASQITVAGVMRLMDGPIAPVACAAASPMEKCSCPDPATCVVRLFMTDVRTQLCKILESQTIEDLSRMSPGASHLAFEI